MSEPKFGMIPRPVFDRGVDAGISGRAWKVLVALCIYADKAGKAFPSYDKLAERTKIARQDLPRILTELVGANLIERHRLTERSKGRPSNSYRLVCETTVCQETDSEGADSRHTDSQNGGATVSVDADLTDHKNKPNKPAQSARAKAKLPIPVDWLPDSEDIDYAGRKGLSDAQIERETERFRDHHLKVGNRFADWRAAWRNWVQRCNTSQSAAPGSTMNSRDRAKAITRAALGVGSTFRAVDSAFPDLAPLRYPTTIDEAGELIDVTPQRVH